jgi:hypothetical protein
MGMAASDRARDKVAWYGISASGIAGVRLDFG